jgi:hypothetical protein
MFLGHITMTLEPWLLAIPGSAVATVAFMRIVGQTTSKAAGRLAARYVGEAIDARMPAISGHVETAMVSALNGRYPMRDDMLRRFESVDKQLVELPKAIVESDLFRMVVRHEVRNAVTVRNFEVDPPAAM